MAELQTICGKCKKKILYFDTVKLGVVKCETKRTQVVDYRGLVREVHLIHECDTRGSKEVPGDKEREQIQRTGDNINDEG